MAGERSSRSTGGFRRLVSGTGLLAVGTCVGIVVGTVWNVPELLIQRLRRPVQVVELAPVELPGPADLPEFRSLQRPAPQRSAPARVSAHGRSPKPFAQALARALTRP